MHKGTTKVIEGKNIDKMCFLSSCHSATRIYGKHCVTFIRHNIAEIHESVLSVFLLTIGSMRLALLYSFTSMLKRTSFVERVCERKSFVSVLDAVNVVYYKLVKNISMYAHTYTYIWIDTECFPIIIQYLFGWSKNCFIIRAALLAQWLSWLHLQRYLFWTSYIITHVHVCQNVLSSCFSQFSALKCKDVWAPHIHLVLGGY